MYEAPVTVIKSPAIFFIIIWSLKFLCPHSKKQVNPERQFLQTFETLY